MVLFRNKLHLDFVGFYWPTLLLISSVTNNMGEKRNKKLKYIPECVDVTLSFKQWIRLGFYSLEIYHWNDLLFPSGRTEM